MEYLGRDFILMLAGKGAPYIFRVTARYLLVVSSHFVLLLKELDAAYSYPKRVLHSGASRVLSGSMRY